MSILFGILSPLSTRPHAYCTVRALPTREHLTRILTRFLEVFAAGNPPVRSNPSGGTKMFVAADGPSPPTGDFEDGSGNSPPNVPPVVACLAVE